jgi:hypothetical protein
MRDLQDTDALDEYTEGTVHLLIEKGRKDMAAAAESMISGEPLEFDLKAVRQTAAEMLTKTRTCAYVRALHTIMFSSCGLAFHTVGWEALGLREPDQRWGALWYPWPNLMCVQRR